MKKPFTISVDKPCSADWSTFSTTSTGGFCPSCEKNVVDFTRMSDEELISFLKKSREQTCGRFRKSQLDERAARSFFSPLSWISAGLVSMLVLTSSLNVQAQDLRTPLSNPESISVMNHSSHSVQWVRGVVRDEEGNAVPGTNVLLKGTKIGTVTDIEGRFEFPRELREGDVLIFSFIGYETQEYHIKPGGEEIVEIEMKMIVDILGEVVVGQAYTSQSKIGRIWTGLKNIFR